MLLVNNLVYDWGRDQTNYQWATFVCAYDGALGPMAVDIIGNHYIGGNPALGTPPPFTPLYAFGTWGLNPGSQVHLSDNVFDGAEPANVNGLDPRVGSPCSGLSYPNTGPGAHVLDFVTAQAGARPTDRDDVDRRIVEQVRTKTGTVIQSQSAVGGWPALAVNVRALSLPAVADEAAFKAGWSSMPSRWKKARRRRWSRRRANWRGVTKNSVNPDRSRPWGEVMRQTLTAKQQRFIDEYLVDYNGTQAAIRAGYAVSSAAQMASQNLAKPAVQAVLGPVLAHRCEWLTDHV